MSSDFWTAFSAIATAVAALVAAGAAVVGILLLRQTLRQAEMAMMQVTVGQEQVEVMQRQLKAQYRPVLEFRRSQLSPHRWLLFNSGTGIAFEIEVHFVDASRVIRLPDVLAPNTAYGEDLGQIGRGVQRPEVDYTLHDGDEIQVTYKDVLGEEYGEPYKYEDKTNRWVYPTE